jgi:eukaryotic-like serine/threonine-protein kinase
MATTGTTSATTRLGFADPLAWIGEPGSAIAALAFGRSGNAAAPDLTQLRHLALLPVDALELDLSDAAQRQFGDYELLELIGQGGMGVVYRARQASLDREVAVKLLAAGPWASRDFIERFKREARNAARMQHPNIVAIYEIGAAEELHFFSMRLVRGQSFAAALRDRGPFDAQRAARLMRTVAEALDYAHSLGVLHLDLKPANVLLDEGGIPHVADFGLARRIDSALAVDSEEVSGTPSYMAPEQAQARAQKITSATDIWGLGAILYELVTCQPPFRAESAQATLKLVVEGQVRRPRRYAPRLPLDLEAIILKCMARETPERYASARDLADDLGRFADGRAVRARPLNAAQRVMRWIRREPKLATAVALTVLALIVGLISTTQQWRRAEANAEHASSVRNFLVSVFEQARPDQNKGQPFTAHQLLEKGEKQLSIGAINSSAMQADLTGLIGTLYWDIGDYARSEQMLKRAVSANADPDVPDDVKARSLLGLAFAEGDKNQHDDAIVHARQALDFASRMGSADARDVAKALRVIARSLTGKGDAKEAEPLLRTALASDRARDGDISTAVVDDMILLGDALYELSRFDESIATSRTAIEAATALYGRQHSKVVEGLQVLARALRDQGNLPEAERALIEAVAIATQVYGPEHRETVVAQSSLMTVLQTQARYAEALKGHLDLLKKAQKMADSRPEQVAYAYNSIAADYLGLGKFHEAELAARDSLSAWARIHGGNIEWDGADAVRALAAALQWQGRYAEAEVELRRQQVMEQQHEPASSGWLNRTRGNLGDLLRMTHRYAEALVELRAAASALPSIPTPIRATVLAQLATAELEAGDAASAQITSAEALAIMRRVLPAGNLRSGIALLASARVKIALGHAGDAEPLLREALAVRSPPFASDDLRVLEVKVALVEALTVLKKGNEAQTLRAEVEPLLKASSTPYATDLRTRLAKLDRPP